jgi:hypothetical protein
LLEQKVARIGAPLHRFPSAYWLGGSLLQNLDNFTEMLAAYGIHDDMLALFYVGQRG